MAGHDTPVTKAKSNPKLELHISILYKQFYQNCSIHTKVTDWNCEQTDRKYNPKLRFQGFCIFCLCDLVFFLPQVTYIRSGARNHQNNLSDQFPEYLDCSLKSVSRFFYF